MTTHQTTGPSGSKQSQRENVMTTVPTPVALDSDTKEILGKVANTIRHLSIDAIQKANSGHPGLPLGCAELGAYLYGHLLKHNPKSSRWLNRDRMILSAGHGSMWLYSCLHLSGFDLSLDEIKNFRQLHSKTPGHPERPETDGVETTTGPLGQGVGNAVGQALGQKLLAGKFNTSDHALFDSKVYCLAGDGCLMEGVSAEVCSLAGHLRLNNLVLIYDANDITLDGPLSESGSEDTAARYRSYGWEVYEIDGHDYDQMHSVFEHLNTKQTAPAIVIAKTVIGKGSPNKQGTHKVHGSPLGEEECKATKAALGLPDEPFHVPQAVRAYFETKLKGDATLEAEWTAMLEAWKDANPTLWTEFDHMHSGTLPETLEADLRAFDIESPIAGRKASNAVLQLLAQKLPQLYGGSADLSCSDLTMLKEQGVVAPGAFTGRNIKFGVREFGMATMANGMAQTDMITPFVGTFLTFSDYMRNAIRLAALMGEQVVYQFTHDSVFLGEDGPTHQPVEHYASLRAIPNCWVLRPADQREVKMAWLAALQHKGPTAIILTRQGLPDIEGTDCAYADGVGRGGYVVRHESGGVPDYTLVATGSEVSLACDVADELVRRGKRVRVVSMPCVELFEKQDKDYRDSVLGGELGRRVSIEAGVDCGWHKYIGRDGIAVCMEGFGASAPAGALAKEFGFTVDAILERLL